MALTNRRGVIASTYDELQALSHLRAAREAFAVPRVSRASATRAALQAAEIALRNVADLLDRAAADVDAKRFGAATVKLSWVAGFHRVMLEIALLVQRIGTTRGTVVGIDDSPAYGAFVDALRRFDHSVGGADLAVAASIAGESLDSVVLRLLHVARIANHDATVWQTGLAAVATGVDAASYGTYVASAELAEAVTATSLSDDTFYTQFRGLHQVPEILAAEVNDRLEVATRLVRNGDIAQAAELIGLVNALMQVIVGCVPPMADNLTTADYHRIRENLGITSGAHSVALHYHLFRDLYAQFGDAVVNAIGTDLPKALEAIEAQRFVDLRAAALHHLIEDALQLRALIDRWRLLHLHLPRNNVGGFSTKSLAGSPDAVEAVRNMRRGAIASDPLVGLAHARGVSSGTKRSALREYLRSAESLDTRVLAATGEITRQRFEDVQQRTGIYSGAPPFVPPPDRIVE